MKTYTHFQKNPESLRTAFVMHWSKEGKLVESGVPKQRAQELVRKGTCFVVTDGSISNKFN